ncbi:MAG: polysulfide reductase NrfD [Desulfobulbaceae bacterium]|jgi:molybdopterin-containing oxidoreductase family membrane subunit|nr:polysulfide reductase NrfD [Desulfobulbaceae bacterium]
MNVTINTVLSILPKSGGLTVEREKFFNISIAVLAALSLVGIFSGVYALWAGHEHTFGVSREIPWGILIAAYVFFVVTSTGLCIVSSIGHVFGFENFAPIAKRAVFLSIVTIISGFLVIAFEIENTWRMPIANVIGFNLTSNIWWMGTLYGLYLVFMVIEFVMLQLDNHKLATACGLAGLLTGVVAHSNLGAVFGLLNGREFWHGPYMPIYFIVSAAMSGCVAILFFTYLAYRFNGWAIDDKLKTSLQSVGKLAALMMAVVLFFTTWKMIAGVTGNPPGKYEAMAYLLHGPYTVNFWIGEITLGLVLPFFLILCVRAESLRVIFIASVAGMIGIFFMRYDLVVVGQLVPHFADMGLVDYPEMFSYTPSCLEALTTMGGFAFCGLLFLLGEKYFRGHVSSGH